jgi:hypothetical protein
MEYRTLDAAGVAAVQRRKLAEVETEHATLALDLRLAGVAGIAGAAVETARDQLAMLEAQHAALVAWLDGEGDA